MTTAIRGLLVSTVLACTCAAPLVLAEDAATAGIEKLSWLEGIWQTESDGRWSEEHWTAPRGGIMLGVNRSGRDARVRSFEFLRIHGDATGTITYWAMPNGSTAVPFVLTTAGEQNATFENPDHDYPTRISYNRAGDELRATISGPDGAHLMTWVWRRSGAAR